VESHNPPPAKGPENSAQEEGSSEDQTDSRRPQDIDLSTQKPTGNGSESEEETQARLDALTSERTALRAEVAQLRRLLEEVQGRHEEELTGIREQLAATKDEKEHAELQYHNLLGKVNTIKSQLGERLKADAVRLPLTC
jgi:predicted  nucleic acid-binding Zn-ribbon protein